MSGRSAYVRKEKTKTKDGNNANDSASERTAPTQASLRDFPMPGGIAPPPDFYRGESATIRSEQSNKSEEMGARAYQRVVKPVVAPVIESRIEKSTFRTRMDKTSEGFRHGLSKTFGKKKKSMVNLNAAARPLTSNTHRPESHELDTGNYIAPPAYAKPRQITSEQDFLRAGPPSSKLPAIPSGPTVKRWPGGGRQPQPWSKLRKDPELWDHNGDVYIYFNFNSMQEPRAPPSFCVSSHYLEATDSRILITMLREGMKDDGQAFNMPPSPISSPEFRPAQLLSPRNKFRQPSPPMSEDNATHHDFDGRISYDITFPVPLGLNAAETVRHQNQTRNALAVICNVQSLTGVNLYQILSDLQDRLDSWLSEMQDPASMIINHLESGQFDDVRESPASAAAILAWSESPTVRWEEGWREAFVHCCGMYSRLESAGDFRHVSPITRALLERASLESQVRVHNCEKKLMDFDYDEYWPQMTAQPPLAKVAFDRCAKFFLAHYKMAYESWPPPAPYGHDQWLTRTLAQKLQKDFGALYDYMVNREISWDCSEERSGRKWNITNPGDRSFNPDTADLPITDILVAFDNNHKYPHIPHPYPLVPATEKFDSIDRNMQNHKDDKMAARVAALAYAECTNIYLLGSEFAANELVEAFDKFEKQDTAGQMDPFSARRGRWVLIYMILQTLASISVDTPGLKFTENVSYHLAPRLRNTPPWKGKQHHDQVEEASHILSHCWTIRDTWNPDPPITMGSSSGLQAQGSRRYQNSLSPSNNYNDYGRQTPLLQRGLDSSHSINESYRSTPILSRFSDRAPSVAPSVASSDAGSSMRSPTLTNVSMHSYGRRTGRKAQQHLNSGLQVTKENLSTLPHRERDFDGMSHSGYGTGIEKLGEWPIREESRGDERGYVASREPSRSRRKDRTESQTRTSTRDGKKERSSGGSAGSNGGQKKDNLLSDVGGLLGDVGQQRRMNKDFTKITDFDDYHF
jgi:hypothetical protein